MSETPRIQWYPGHMAKARRLISESLKLVDCVAELTDARIPESSRNPELDELCAVKPRILLLNKCDLADEAETARWVARYRERGLSALAVDSRSGRGVERFVPLLRKVLAEKLRSLQQKGMAGRPLRVMVAGVPNVGKSAFINRLAGSRRAKAEDRPGVTRGRQWIAIASGLELMDTPGILWPKFDDLAVGERLAFTGAVRDEVVDGVLLARRLCETLALTAPRAFAARYKLPEPLASEGEVLLQDVAKKRGMLLQGGEVDVERAAATVLDEFRSGRIGHITLEPAGGNLPEA